MTEMTADQRQLREEHLRDLNRTAFWTAFRWAFLTAIPTGVITTLAVTAVLR